MYSKYYGYIDCSKFKKIEVLILETKQEMFRQYFWVLNKWLHLKNQNISLCEHPALKDKKIAIYGMGNLGKRLIEDLEISGKKIAYVIDLNAEYLFASFELYKPEDELPMADVLVITLVDKFEDIKDVMKTNFQGDIISLSEIVDYFWIKEWERI